MKSEKKNLRNGPVFEGFRIQMGKVPIENNNKQ